MLTPTWASCCPGEGSRMRSRKVKQLALDGGEPCHWDSKVVAKSSGTLQRLGHSNMEPYKTIRENTNDTYMYRSKNLRCSWIYFQYNTSRHLHVVFFLGVFLRWRTFAGGQSLQNWGLPGRAPMECTRCHAHVRPYKLVGVEVLSIHVFSPWL